MATKPKPTTAVAVKASANIVNIQEMLKAQAQAMGGRIAPSTGATIRVTQDKQFVLPDGTKTPGPLELVIVEFTSKNSFYEGAYDPKNISSPVCFAVGNDPKNLVPSKNSPVPQATSCGTCPMAQFGSAGDSKACKEMRTMAVLPPDADADTPLWILSTSPTANKGFDSHVATVARVFEMPPVGVVTTVSFDTSVTYAKLVFSNPQPNPQVGTHFARQDEAKQMLAIEPDVSGYVAKPKGKVAGRR